MNRVDPVVRRKEIIQRQSLDGHVLRVFQNGAAVACLEVDLMSTVAAILLVVADRRHRRILAVRLRALGCVVYLADDLDDAADLILVGLQVDLILVRQGPRYVSASVLQSEMVKRLPGSAVTARAAFDLDDEDEIGDWVDEPLLPLLN